MDETAMMQRQMNPMAANPMGVDMDAAFKAEKAALGQVGGGQGGRGGGAAHAHIAPAVCLLTIAFVAFGSPAACRRLSTSGSWRARRSARWRC